MTPTERLRYHVTGAVERGEARAIAGQPAKTPGQLAYEEDCRRCPTYHDGGARPSWANLDHWAKPTWERNPTPREMRHLPNRNA